MKSRSALLVLAIWTGCTINLAKGVGGDLGAEETVNENLMLPAGSYELSGTPTEDMSITTTGGGNGSVDVMPGMPTSVSIPFTAPNGNIIGGGIRFGTSGPIHVVPIPSAMGKTSGMLSFQFTIPQSICGMLGDICHSIKCYEFAVTSAGTISKANITQVAMACNDCTEPSCQSLLMSCQQDCPAGCPQGMFCLNGQCVSPDSCTNRCCPGRDDSCTPAQASCYCDSACRQFSDCCSDVAASCGF